jgi:hypothetical protein
MSGKGRNVGTAMPQALRNPARRLAATLSRPGLLHGRDQHGHTIYGQRLHPDVFRMSRKAKEILNTPHRPWHSTSIYTGMIRQEKYYKGTAQSQYTTFRRISSKVSINRKTGQPATAEHWIHPGITPRHFANKTQAYVESIAPDIITNVIGK